MSGIREISDLREVSQEKGYGHVAQAEPCKPIGMLNIKGINDIDERFEFW